MNVKPLTSKIKSVICSFTNFIFKFKVFLLETRIGFRSKMIMDHAIPNWFEQFSIEFAVEVLVQQGEILRQQIINFTRWFLNPIILVHQDDVNFMIIVNIPIP